MIAICHSLGVGSPVEGSSRITAKGVGSDHRAMAGFGVKALLGSVGLTAKSPCSLSRKQQGLDGIGLAASGMKLFTRSKYVRI